MTNLSLADSLPEMSLYKKRNKVVLVGGIRGDCGHMIYRIGEEEVAKVLFKTGWGNYEPHFRTGEVPTEELREQLVNNNEEYIGPNLFRPVKLALVGIGDGPAQPDKGNKGYVPALIMRKVK